MTPEQARYECPDFFFVINIEVTAMIKKKKSRERGEEGEETRETERERTGKWGGRKKGGLMDKAGESKRRKYRERERDREATKGGHTRRRGRRCKV